MGGSHTYLPTFLSCKFGEFSRVRRGESITRPGRGTRGGPSCQRLKEPPLSLLLFLLRRRLGVGVKFDFPHQLVRECKRD